MLTKKGVVAGLAFATAAFATAAMADPASPAGEGRVACSRADMAHGPIGVIVTGQAVKAPPTMKTYRGDAYWLTLDELKEIKDTRGGGSWAALWATARYSHCHDHGVPEYGFSVAAGVDLKRLLAAAGLTDDEIAAVDLLRVTASDGYSMPLNLQERRYVFMTPDAVSGDIVEPMLALYRDRADTYSGLPAEATTAVSGDHPTLLYGQLAGTDSNQCGFVQSANEVTLPAAAPALVIDAPDAFDPTARQKSVFTLAGLIKDGDVRRTYLLEGETHVCDGIDLASLLSKARGAMGPRDTITVVTSDGSVDTGITVGDVVEGAYLIAYYSECSSSGAIGNATQCRLYGEGMMVADVTALRIEKCPQATAALRLSSPTVSQTKAYRLKGSKLALRATSTRALGAAAAEPVVWRSSKAAVARVAANGTVTARAPGTAVITAASGAFTRRFTVVVVARARRATRITLPARRSMTVGATAKAGARLYPATATVTVTWRSSNAAIVKVDRGGTLTAVKRGKARVTVRTSNGRSATCVVRVR